MEFLPEEYFNKTYFNKFTLKAMREFVSSKFSDFDTTDASRKDLTKYLLLNKSKIYKTKEVIESKSQLIKTKEEQWVFTDGSCINNGKSFSCGGYGVFFGDNDTRNVAKKAEGKTTNNKEELKAILNALQIIKKDPITKYILYTDSQYSLNAITNWANKWAKNNWRKSDGKPVENKEIIKEAFEIYNSINNVSFVHVRSHKKPPKDKNSKEYQIWYGNDMADKLANKYN